MRSLSLLACLAAVLLASSDFVDGKVQRVRHPKLKRPHHQARTIGAYNDLARELNARSSSSGSVSSTGWNTKAPSTTAPKANVWKALSNDEAASVIEFLHAQGWLNLTSVDNATRCVSFSSLMDVTLNSVSAGIIPSPSSKLLSLIRRTLFLSLPPEPRPLSVGRVL